MYTHEIARQIQGNFCEVSRFRSIEESKDVPRLSCPIFARTAGSIHMCVIKNHIYHIHHAYSQSLMLLCTYQGHRPIFARTAGSAQSVQNTPHLPLPQLSKLWGGSQRDLRCSRARICPADPASPTRHTYTQMRWSKSEVGRGGSWCGYEREETWQGLSAGLFVWRSDAECPTEAMRVAMLCKGRWMDFSGRVFSCVAMQK